MKLEWVKLERFSDWAYIYLAEPGKGLSQYGTSSARDYALPFRNKLRMRVRWPNGNVSEAEIIMREFRSSYNDMGHTYTTRYELPGVVRDVDGIKKWIALDKLEVLRSELPTRKEENP